MADKQHSFAFSIDDYIKADVRAVKALAEGQASGEMQKRAFQWILRKASAAQDVSFRPGEPDVTAYLEGRRSVGLAMLKLLSIDPETLKR